MQGNPFKMRGCLTARKKWLSEYEKSKVTTVSLMNACYQVANVTLKKMEAPGIYRNITTPKDSLDIRSQSISLWGKMRLSFLEPSIRDGSHNSTEKNVFL